MSLIVVIHNDSTGSYDVGNYDFTVWINQHQIYAGRVEGHLRELAWPALVARCAEVGTRDRMERAAYESAQNTPRPSPGHDLQAWIRGAPDLG